MRKNHSVLRLTLSAMLLAVGLLLPFLTGQIPQIGKMLCPMHLPVFLCGMVCGPFWGLAVGAITPVLRSALFGMPVMMPTAVGMAFELAAYGFVSGVLRRRLPRTIPALYAALITAMIAGRCVWGLASIFLYGFTSGSFTWQLFVSGGFVNALPGIVLQLIIVPPLAQALGRLISAE